MQRTFLFLPVAAALLLLPLLLHGPSCGHDFDFHLQSWLAAARDFHTGVWAPHWLPAANYGAGEPRFLFYPPLSWLLGAALGGIAPWAAAPQLFTGVALLAAGWGMWWLLRVWVAPAVALPAAMLYMANPYMLFVVYERTAYGELLGAVWAPLLVSGALRASVAGVALPMAALWFSNGPAAVMGGYAALAVGAWCAARQRALRPLLLVVTGLLLGTALAGDYVVPAAAERGWVELTRATEAPMRVEDSFLFGHTADALHDQVLHTASLLGVFLLATGAGALLLLLLRGWRKEAGLASALGTLALLLLPVSLPLYHHLPELALLQFPWRWLLFGSVAVTLALAVLLRELGVHGRWLPATLALLLCAAAGPWAAHAFSQACDEEDNVAAQLLLHGIEGTDEYTPAGADTGEIQKGLPAVRVLARPDEDEGDDTVAANPDWQPRRSLRPVSIEEWSPEHMRFRTPPCARCYAVVRLLQYPAWRIRMDGATVQPLAREDGLVVIALPATPTAATVEITWHTTPDVWAGRALSALAALLLGGLLWRRRAASQPARQRLQL